MICTDQLNTQYFLDLAYQMGMCNGENAFITLDFVVPMSDDLDHLGKPVNRNAYEGKITLMLLFLDLLITTACVPDLQPLRVSDLKTHNYAVHITTQYTLLQSLHKAPNIKLPRTFRRFVRLPLDHYISLNFGIFQ